MQNKPNLPDAQMNLNFYLTKYYENQPLRRLPENKPNQTQSFTPPVQSNLVGDKRQWVLFRIGQMPAFAKGVGIGWPIQVL